MLLSTYTSKYQRTNSSWTSWQIFSHVKVLWIVTWEMLHADALSFHQWTSSLNHHSATSSSSSQRWSVPTKLHSSLQLWYRNYPSRCTRPQTRTFLSKLFRSARIKAFNRCHLYPDFQKHTIVLLQQHLKIRCTPAALSLPTLQVVQSRFLTQWSICQDKSTIVCIRQLSIPLPTTK